MTLFAIALWVLDLAIVGIWIAHYFQMFGNFFERHIFSKLLGTTCWLVVCLAALALTIGRH